MGEAGILHEDDRVELIEGELIEMHAIGGSHIRAVMRLTRILTIAAGEAAWVSVQSSVRLDDVSEPEPDIALLHPRAGDACGTEPPLASDVLLLIEVASSSLAYDRGIKLPLYARHAIPEVWIVDLDKRAVSVHRDPRGDSYASVTHAGGDDVIAPAALAAARVSVRDLFGPER